MFEGFELERVDVGEAVLRVRYGGSGPAVMLLHGHPRTHATWHGVAPLLAEEYTVVCPDLRGYGESSKPASTPDHEPYSKQALARDCIALMRLLGHDRFAVVGHDRGCYVAQRLALDSPEAVTHLAALDGVPIGDALARCDARFAQAWWHWFFLGQTDKLAERVISTDPDAWYGVDASVMGEEAYADLRSALHDPGRARDVRGLPSGAGNRSRAGRCRPRFRPPDPVSGACRVGTRGRLGRALRGPDRDLEASLLVR